jgi:hypothetical protein
MQAGGLTKKQEQAALWLAEGERTEEAIAAALRLNPITLWRWKQQPAFAALVEEHKARWAAEIEQEGIANRQNRVNALNDRWELMQRVIDARAADATMTGAGHETGLLVRTYKPGKYRNVEEYRVDAALLAELRAHELQAARELGQLVEKRELTGKDGGPLEVEHGGAIEVRAVDYRMTTATLHPLPAALGATVDEEGVA